MSSLFKRIKPINQIDRDIVIGYTKGVQTLIKSQQIPMAICYLCLLYFYDFDYFEKAGKGMKINENGDIIEIIKRTGCTGYGKWDIGVFQIRIISFSHGH